MSSTIDYDLFGHCIVCHKNMLFEQIIDGKAQMRFSPEYTEKEFILDDNSKMRVAMCREHASKVTKKDYKDIMKTVVKGWDKETDELVKSPNYPSWTQERKMKYMSEYEKKSIKNVSEDDSKKVNRKG